VNQWQFFCALLRDTRNKILNQNPSPAAPTSGHEKPFAKIKWPAILIILIPINFVATDFTDLIGAICGNIFSTCRIILHL